MKQTALQPSVFVSCCAQPTVALGWDALLMDFVHTYKNYSPLTLIYLVD